MWRLIILVALVLAACGTTGGTGGTGGQTGTMQVDSVEVRIAESYPVQVFANIKGTLGDGCTSLGETRQSRNGSTIEVTITTNHSGADACTQIAQLVDQDIQLEGEFPAGTYTVRVNGVEKQFTVS
jgi:hypothetical protein